MIINMKRILTLLLTACLTLPVFAQIAQRRSAEEAPKPAYSWQPFVVGGAAIGQPTSFRLQAGLVKRWGFYVAGTTNFRFAQPDGDFGDEPYYLWTGKHFYTRWILHTGPVIRVNRNFMMYLGAGFGKCLLLNETVSGHKLYSHDHHLIDDWTIEIDLGFMYRIKSFIISAGFSCGDAINVLYPTGNIGLGIMF